MFYITNSFLSISQRNHFSLHFAKRVQTARLSELKAPDASLGFILDLATRAWESWERWREHLSFSFSQLRILRFCHLSLPWWTTHSMRACLHFPPWGCLRDGAQFRKADFNSAFLFTGRNESSSAGRAGLRESHRQACEHVRKCSRASTFAPSSSIVLPLSALPIVGKIRSLHSSHIPPVSNL